LKIATVLKGTGILIGLFALIQLIPYGRNHTNPPVVNEIKWDNAQTRLLAQRACFDCHSNQTLWPWYSYVAPMSWLIQRDVDEGRRVFNFDTWGTSSRSQRLISNGGRELTDAILNGRMPPFYYSMIHPSAILNTAEKDQLIQGLNDSLSTATVSP
jgi:hypothetical protein